MKSLKTYPLVLMLFERDRAFVSMHTARKIYKGLIEPHFDYCSAVWDGLTQQLSEKLQNRAIRVITKSCYDIRRFLTRTVGKILRLQGLNKRLI